MWRINKWAQAAFFKYVYYAFPYHFTDVNIFYIKMPNYFCFQNKKKQSHISSVLDFWNLLSQSASCVIFFSFLCFLTMKFYFLKETNVKKVMMSFYNYFAEYLGKYILLLLSLVSSQKIKSMQYFVSHFLHLQQILYIRSFTKNLKIVQTAIWVLINF